MRYIKLSQVANVEGFDPYNGYYSCTKKGKNYLFISDTFIEKEDSPLDLSFRDKYMYVWYGSGKFELYSGSVLLKTIEKNTCLLNEQTLYIGTFLDLKTFETYFNLMSPLDEQPLLKNSIPYLLYAEVDVIIAYDNFRSEFKRINTDTESLWEFPLSSLGDVEYAPGENDRIDKILGIAHGNLWIYTYFDRLVALSVKTGDKLFSFDCFGVYLDVKTENIFAIASNIISIIDTQALTIKEEYNFLEADPTGIGRYYSVFNPLLQGDYFTFIGEKEREYSGCGWAGIFDYKARKLVWECEIISQEERRTTGNHLIAPQQLYMSGDKLYIKDFLKNLHIFEREE